MTKRIPDAKKAILAHLKEYGTTGPYNLWLAIPTRNLMTLTDAVASLQEAGKIEVIQEGERVKLAISNNPIPCPVCGALKWPDAKCEICRGD